MAQDGKVQEHKTMESQEKTKLTKEKRRVKRMAFE